MSAEEEIRRRIRERGAITFAEFMDIALFWPQGGYYPGAGDVIGPAGDYYTSPLAHPAFGALLAVQLFQMWQLLGQPTAFTVVELGAGHGLLCRDVAAFSGHLPAEFHRSLRYLCLDRRAAPGAERDLKADSGVPAAARIAGLVPPAPFPESKSAQPPSSQRLKSPLNPLYQRGVRDISPINRGEPSGGFRCGASPGAFCPMNCWTLFRSTR